MTTGASAKREPECGGARADVCKIHRAGNRVELDVRDGTSVVGIACMNSATWEVAKSRCSAASLSPTLHEHELVRDLGVPAQAVADAARLRPRRRWDRLPDPNKLIAPVRVVRTGLNEV